MDNNCALRVLGGGSRAEDGDKELADGHADGTPEEERAAAKLIDGVETRQGGHDVNGVGNHLDDECIGYA